jgi:DNA-binding CsgD family transcriptional regulator
MESISNRIANAPTLPVLWRQMTRYFSRHGFGGVSYYWLRTGTRLPAIIPLQYGFTREQRDIYRAFDFERLDILPRTALVAGRPIRWSDIWRDAQLSDEERAFLTALREKGVTDGFSLPCYGPNGRDAVVGLGKMTAKTDLSADHLALLHFSAQAAHLRICALFADAAPPARFLSRRETEILSWVARGKSNGVIADILQISSGTVDTYMRRIYEKLDVSDRTSAAVKAVGLGLIPA